MKSTPAAGRDVGGASGIRQFEGGKTRREHTHRVECAVQMKCTVAGGLPVVGVGESSAFRSEQCVDLTWSVSILAEWPDSQLALDSNEVLEDTK